MGARQRRDVRLRHRLLRHGGRFVLRGVCPRNVPVDVHLLGGILSITITADDDILMTGPAETAFVGCVEV